MRNAQFTHDDRGKQDDQEHDKEDERRALYWEI